MRIAETKLYTYDELGDSAKRKVLEEVSTWDLYFWDRENSESFDEFVKFVGAYNSDYQYGIWGYSFAKISVNEPYNMTVEEWVKDSAWLIEKDCPFTGYYMDEEILQPMRNYLKSPDDRTFQELVNDCADAWVEACKRDIEYAYSEEAIVEFLTANEYEFTENGKVW